MISYTTKFHLTLSRIYDSGPVGQSNLHDSNPRFITENNFQPENRVLKRVIVDTYLIFLYTKLQVLMKNISFTPYQLFEKR